MYMELEILYVCGKTGICNTADDIRIEIGQYVLSIILATYEQRLISIAETLNGVLIRGTTASGCAYRIQTY